MASSAPQTMSSSSGLGWKIEKRYIPKVLIGNWQEERLANQKEYYRPISTYSIDFKGHREACPDVIVRRHAELANDGLAKEVIFGHGADVRRNGDMISWYDEHYNGRTRDESNKLPPLRHFSSSSVSWVPEKSDHPLTGEPTNFGLRDKLRRQWADEISQSMRCPSGSFTSNSTYRSAFVHWPRSVYVTSKQQNARFAAQGTRPESSVL